QLVNLSAARAELSDTIVDLRIVSGDGAIVAADETHDAALLGTTSRPARTNDASSESAASRSTAAIRPAASMAATSAPIFATRKERSSSAARRSGAAPIRWSAASA